MAQFVELVTGAWLEGLDEDVSRDAQALCRVLTQGVLDGLLALVMFEQASSVRHDHSRDASERERALERAEEEKLAAQDQRGFADPDYGEWRTRLSEQARRNVARAKWETGELPAELKHRLPFLHAESFVTSLARVSRALRQLAKLDTGNAKQEVIEAGNDLEAALPALKGIRDSVEHAEDRMRGLNRQKQTMTLAPVMTSMIHAPGGALIAGQLIGQTFGWTVDDGTLQEVEVSDVTVEAARAAVQRALDALPWRKHGYPQYVPR